MSGEWQRASQGCTKPSLNIVTDDIMTEGSRSVNLGITSVDMPWPIINTANASTKVDDYIDQTAEYTECIIDNYNVKPLIENIANQASQVDYSPLIDAIKQDVTTSLPDIKTTMMNKIGDRKDDIRSAKDQLIGASTTMMIILTCFITLMGGLFIFLAISRNALIGSILVISLLVTGFFIAKYIINPKIETSMNRFYCSSLRADSIDDQCPQNPT